MPLPTHSLRRRAGGEGHRSELAKIQRTLKQVLNVIEEGGHARGMIGRVRELEAREDAPKELLAQCRQIFRTSIQTSQGSIGGALSD
jgi:hypothetical protein